MMRITSKKPCDWRDLQNWVALLFNQAGYAATSPKTIPLVRGKVEVDVFVVANHEIFNTIICECKFWNTPVSQEKVHAFRTIVQDSGAMLGIIISKAGFQKGAIEAAQNSNVILKTWEEFQEILLIPWTQKMIRRIREISYPLSVYTDPLDCDKQLKQLNYFDYKKINEKYVEGYISGRWLIDVMSKEYILKTDYGV